MPFVFGARLGEPVRIETLRAVPQFRQPVVHSGPQVHIRAGRDVVAQYLGIPHGPADVERQWSHHPQRLIDHQVQGFQLVQRLDIQGPVADPGAFVAAAVLPLRVGGQVIGHRRQRRGRGVMGGHHQEDHVVGDIGVAETVAVIVGGVAEHRQHVGALGIAPGPNPLDEIVLQHLSGLEPAPPLEWRHRCPDDRPAGPHGGGERLVDRGHQVPVAARLVAHEYHRGDVEGEFLDCGHEKKAGIVGGPVAAHHRRGDGVHMLDVARQSGAGESLLHDPPVVHMFVEIHQQQAAVEERPDDRFPGPGRKILVPVGEHLLGGVRTQCGDCVERGCLAVVHRAEFAIGLQDVIGSAAKDLDEMAHHRQARVAHDGFEPTARRWLGEDELLPGRHAQFLVEQSHPGNGVQGRGEPAPGLVEQVLRRADSGHRRSSNDKPVRRLNQHCGSN